MQPKKTAASPARDRISALILQGLDKKENISDIDCCATRLRVTVIDPAMVQEALLKESGASVVIHKGNGIKVIYGPQVSVIKSNLDDFLDATYADHPESLLNDPTPDPIRTAPKESKAPAARAEKTDAIRLGAPVSGTVVPLSEVQDEVFSQRILGDGITFQPSEGKLYAPCDGTMHMVFDTEHAISLVSEDGCEILLHIGIDTVKLNGKFFHPQIVDEQQIKKRNASHYVRSRYNPKRRLLNRYAHGSLQWRCIRRYQDPRRRQN